MPHQETTVAPFTVGQGVLPTGSTGHANAQTEPSMAEELFREDATLTTCEARITCIDERGVQLERTIFYPLGGGRAGDRGALILPDGSDLQIADTHNGTQPGEILHVPAAGQEARLDFHIVEPVSYTHLDVYKRQPMKSIADPACGTGGFFLGAYNWLTRPGNRLDKKQKEFLHHQTFHGNEIVPNTRRMCLMNLFLHNIGAVSYTHLDVYKRQGTDCAGGARGT